mmetsp:Transcript_96333/g.299453  ORF Transcript_96333/g.299453 Transcript_96333/m.299453 type:complete len:406 (-) Transcript_96333:33-1250(-)
MGWAEERPPEGPELAERGSYGLPEQLLALRSESRRGVEGEQAELLQRATQLTEASLQGAAQQAALEERLRAAEARLEGLEQQHEASAKVQAALQQINEASQRCAEQLSTLEQRLASLMQDHDSSKRTTVASLESVSTAMTALVGELWTRAPAQDVRALCERLGQLETASEAAKAETSRLQGALREVHLVKGQVCKDIASEDVATIRGVTSELQQVHAQPDSCSDLGDDERPAGAPQGPQPPLPPPSAGGRILPRRPSRPKSARANAPELQPLAQPSAPPGRRSRPPSASGAAQRQRLRSQEEASAALAGGLPSSMVRPAMPLKPVQAPRIPQHPSTAPATVYAAMSASAAPDPAVPVVGEVLRGAALSGLEELMRRCEKFHVCGPATARVRSGSERAAVTACGGR